MVLKYWRQFGQSFNSYKGTIVISDFIRLNDDNSGFNSYKGTIVICDGLTAKETLKKLQFL